MKRRWSGRSGAFGERSAADVLIGRAMTVLRTSASVIALTAMVAASSITVQAADATLRLSCEGMVTVTDKVTVTDNTKNGG